MLDEETEEIMYNAPKRPPLSLQETAERNRLLGALRQKMVRTNFIAETEIYPVAISNDSVPNQNSESRESCQKLPPQNLRLKNLRIIPHSSMMTKDDMIEYFIETAAFLRSRPDVLDNEVVRFLAASFDLLSQNRPLDSFHPLDTRENARTDSRAPNDVNTKTNNRDSIANQKSESRGSDQIPKSDLPSFSTLKDLALYLFHNVENEIRSSVLIGVLYANKRIMMRLSEFTDGKELENLGSTDLTGVYRLGFDHAFDDARKLDFRLLQKVFFPSEVTVRKLAKAINDASELNEEVLVHVPDLVQVEGERNARYEEVLDKSAALIITGESGSGKSWYVQHNLRDELQCNSSSGAFVYVEADAEMYKRNFAVASEKFYDPTEDPEMTEVLYNLAMQALGEIGLLEGRIYDTIRMKSTQYSLVRNSAAWQTLQDLVAEKLSGNIFAKDWWDQLVTHEHNRRIHGPCSLVDELVIVIDDMGKIPECARGLLHEIRDIHRRLSVLVKGTKVQLVIVGSGLERLEEKKIVGLEETMIGGYCPTDPPKCNVLTLKGPIISGSNIGVPWEDILGGTYSRILATNTRMLTTGVLPLMASKFIMDPTLGNVPVSAIRKQWGSDGCVMEYAVNRVASLDPPKRKLVIANQFRVLVKAAIVRAREETAKRGKNQNPFFGDVLKGLDVHKYDEEELLSLGLITANRTNISSALCYLACGGGMTVPFVGNNGASLATVLQHHLVRLSQVQYGDSFCQSYDLKRAWPPWSRKGDEELKGRGAVRREIKHFVKTQDSAYNNDNDDVNAVKKILDGKKVYTLVLRQTAPNAQGPNVLLLSKRNENSCATLDLFRCKEDVGEVQRFTTDIYMRALWSIGVQMDEHWEEPMIEPTKGLAGYSYQGMQELAIALTDVLGYDVNIGDRCLVLSRKWIELEEQYHNNLNALLIKNDNVHIWTSEMLEPTISLTDKK